MYSTALDTGAYTTIALVLWHSRPYAPRYHDLTHFDLSGEDLDIVYSLARPSQANLNIYYRYLGEVLANTVAMGC